MRRPLLSLFFFALACEQPAPKPKPQPKSASTQAAPNAALAPHPGDSATDLELRDLQKKLARQPKSVDLWELLARAWVKKAREAQDPSLYGRAQLAADEALRLQPMRVGALEVKALVLQNEHRFQDMKRVAELMLKQDPKDYEAWALLGDAELELGAYDSVVAAYQKMLDLRPGLPAYARAAYLRWLTGDIDGALQMWQEAIAVGFNKNAEQLAYCFAENGLVHWLKGDLEAALIEQEKALALVPNYAPALVGRGKIRFAKGDLVGSQQDFAAAVKTNATVEAYRWLAAIARQNKDEDTAKDAEAKLEIEGRRGDFRNLSLFYSTKNQSSNAALALAKKDAEQRGGVYTEDALAFALFRGGDFAAAKTHIDAALAQGTKDPMLFAHAGLIYNALADTAKAKEMIDAAFALNPAFDPLLAAEVKTLREKLTPTSTP